METLSVSQDVPQNESASPKGDDGVLCLGLASGPKVVEKADKPTTVSLSGGDSPRFSLVTDVPLSGLKEQIEYEGNDVHEISDIGPDNNGQKEYSREYSKSEKNETDPTDMADDKNSGDGEKNSLVVIDEKLVHCDEVDGQTIDSAEDDFDHVEDLEELLDEHVATLVNSIILRQIQQNDGTLSVEEATALCESASDIEIIDSLGGDRGSSDAMDVVNQGKVVRGWKIRSPNGTLHNLKMSASDVRADAEVEEIMEALDAAVAAEQIQQGRKWRAHGSLDLADSKNPSSYYEYDTEEDIDYDQVVCQACTRGIEICTCADFEAKDNEEKKQLDEVQQELPQFEVSGVAEACTLNDSCDGDVEDSCSQPDDSEFALGSRAQRSNHTHRGQKFSQNPPVSAIARPQPRRSARPAIQPSKANDGKDSHDSDSVDDEKLKKRAEICLGAIKKACTTAAPHVAEPARPEKNMSEYSNNNSNQPRNPRTPNNQHDKPRPCPKSIRTEQRKQKKSVNKYLLKLQKAAENGDHHAAAELATFEFKVETEVKDVGYGEEVILHMPLLQLRDHVRKEYQKMARDCDAYWKQVLEKEKRRLADAFADIYVKNASIKKLSAELDKADRMISGNKRLIDQLEAEVKQLRESKRLRSFNKKQKQRQRGQQENQFPPGCDDNKAKKYRDQQ